MYITGKHRYDNYTSRYDVYLFTLRDYTEVLLDKFKGSYLERSDMPIHSGYLLQFVDINSAKEFIKGISTSNKVSGKITTYVLPHLEGNELPLYATVAEGVNIVYIGLSDFPEALDKYVDKSVDQKFTISFNAGAGSGEMQSVQVNGGSDYTVPESTFNVPVEEGKTWIFDNWKDTDNNSYDPGDKIEGVSKNITLTAQFIQDI